MNSGLEFIWKYPFEQTCLDVTVPRAYLHLLFAEFVILFRSFFSFFLSEQKQPGVIVCDCDVGQEAH